MLVCVITLSAGFQKARRTQQKGTNCLQFLCPLGKQPSFSSPDQNNWMERSKRRFVNARQSHPEVDLAYDLVNVHSGRY
jgi:hypothetical protein